MSQIDTPYATDEDVAVRAPADFLLVGPRDQVLASGADGVFEAGDRWTLRSSSVDFAARGIAPGHVIRLIGPSSSFPAFGSLFAVASVAAGSVTLRILGQPAGVGQPPAPSGGLSGVEFLAVTLAPQIEAAGYDLDRRFGVDPGTPGRRRRDLVDPRELREATILTVLHRRYLDLGRTADGPLAGKAALLLAERDEVLARVALHWLAPDAGASTTMFGTRMGR